MASIELHFKKSVGGQTSSGVLGFGEHAFLIYRNDSGNVTGYSRGGNEFRRPSPIMGPGIFGYIVTDYGEYTATTPDFDENVLNNDRGFLLYAGSEQNVEAIKQSDYSTLNTIGSLNLSYRLLAANSNSVVGTIIKKNGFSIPSDAQPSINSAPAFDQNLLDPSYINSDRIDQNFMREWKDRSPLLNIISYDHYDKNGINNTVIGENGGYYQVNNSNVIVVDKSTASIISSNSKILLGSNANLSVSGVDNIYTLTANAGTGLGVSGQRQVVYGDSGSNYVNLNTANTQATVYGGGYIGLTDWYQNLTVGDWGSTVQLANGIQGGLDLGQSRHGQPQPRLRHQRLQYGRGDQHARQRRDLPRRVRSASGRLR